MTAILVLGMHRSGTSCLAAVLAAAGARVPGDSLRNWDNPQGHHEATALVRLNDDVLAHSGGHWLEAPDEVRWTEAQATERDRLLALTPEGRPALLKDPRSLLTLPFWRASPVPHHRIGVVRHPLAVARSLLTWRQTAMDDGLALWLVHNRALAEAGCPILDFALPPAFFVAACAARCPDLGLSADLPAMTASYVPDLVHHDAGDGPAGSLTLRGECTRLHQQMTGNIPAVAPAGTFPWSALEAFRQAVAARDDAGAIQAAGHACAGADPAAPLAPIATTCLGAHRGDLLLVILDRPELGERLAPGLRHLLSAKAHLDQKEPAIAAGHLELAGRLAEPLYEARHLLPVALHAAGRLAEADAAAAALLPVALYPFRVHARRAEWAWGRGETVTAFAHLEAALATAPAWRQGRLLFRRSAWKAKLGDHDGAAADRRQAATVDPGWNARE